MKQIRFELFFLMILILTAAVMPCWAVTPVKITKSGENIIDDKSSGFEKGGTDWWEAAIGYNSHMWYTYAVNSATDGSAASGCYGKWYMKIEDAGNYEVLVYIPSQNATSKQAKYKLWRTIAVDKYEEEFPVIDQSAHPNQWVTLGNFYFVSGDAALLLKDDTGESYNLYKRKLAYDAIKLVNTDSTLPVTGTDQAHFVSDGEYVDFKEVRGGTSFIKEWTIKNTGTTTWNSKYVFKRKESGTQLSIDTSDRPINVIVPPVSIYTFKVEMKAPDAQTALKTYREDWSLYNPNGLIIKIDLSDTLWVTINVPASSSNISDIVINTIDIKEKSKWYHLFKVNDIITVTANASGTVNQVNAVDIKIISNFTNPGGKIYPAILKRESLNGNSATYVGTIILTTEIVDTKKGENEKEEIAFVEYDRDCEGCPDNYSGTDNESSFGQRFLADIPQFSKKSLASANGNERLKIPPATSDYLKAGGFETLTVEVVNVKQSPKETIFVRNQADWLIYTGHGLSCSGAIYTRKHDSPDDSSPSLFYSTDSDWKEDLKGVMIFGCSILNFARNKDVDCSDVNNGKKWFDSLKGGPNVVLGYDGKAPILKSQHDKGNNGFIVLNTWKWNWLERADGAADALEAWKWTTDPEPLDHGIQKIDDIITIVDRYNQQVSEDKRIIISPVKDEEGYEVYTNLKNYNAAALDLQGYFYHYWERPNSNALREWKSQKIVLSSAGLIYPNQKISETVALYSSSSAFTAHVSWPGSDLDLIITTPSGKKLSPNSEEVVNFYEGETEEYYTIISSEEGEWNFDIIGVDVAEEGEPYEFIVFVNDHTASTTTDTDNDGLPDSWEMTHFGTMSRDGSTDFDGDGIPDIDEYKYGFDPKTDDAAIDSDGDGVSNLDEYYLGSDPNDPKDPPCEDSASDITAKPGKVIICHKGKETLEISTAALKAHLAHGDTEGPCQSAACDRTWLRVDVGPEAELEATDPDGKLITHADHGKPGIKFETDAQGNQTLILIGLKDGDYQIALNGKKNGKGKFSVKGRRGGDMTDVTEEIELETGKTVRTVVRVDSETGDMHVETPDDPAPITTTTSTTPADSSTTSTIQETPPTTTVPEVVIPSAPTTILSTATTIPAVIIAPAPTTTIPEVVTAPDQSAAPSTTTTISDATPTTADVIAVTTTLPYNAVTATSTTLPSSIESESDSETSDNFAATVKIMLASLTGEVTVDASMNDAEVLLSDVESLTDTDASLNQENKPDGYTFIHGMVKFKAVSPEHGKTMRVKITYPEDIPPDAQCYRVNASGFYPLAKEYFEIDGRVLTLMLTDGGIGDDDGGVNGMVTDTVGIAVSDGDDSSSCYIQTMVSDLIVPTLRRGNAAPDAPASGLKP